MFFLHENTHVHMGDDLGTVESPTMAFGLHFSNANITFNNKNFDELILNHQHSINDIQELSTTDISMEAESTMCLRHMGLVSDADYKKIQIGTPLYLGKIDSIDGLPVLTPTVDEPPVFIGVVTQVNVSMTTVESGEGENKAIYHKIRFASHGFLQVKYDSADLNVGTKITLGDTTCVVTQVSPVVKIFR